MKMILKLCAMEFFDTDSIFDKMFHFRETPAFQTKMFENGEEKSGYADAGYESANFFLNIGPIFFLVIFYAVYVLLKKLL